MHPQYVHAHAHAPVQASGPRARKSGAETLIHPLRLTYTCTALLSPSGTRLQGKPEACSEMQRSLSPSPSPSQPSTHQQRTPQRQGGAFGGALPTIPNPLFQGFSHLLRPVHASPSLGGKKGAPGQSCFSNDWVWVAGAGKTEALRLGTWEAAIKIT